MKERGFGLTGILLIILAVSVIGVGGLQVYKKLDVQDYIPLDYPSVSLRKPNKEKIKDSIKYEEPLLNAPPILPTPPKSVSYVPPATPLPSPSTTPVDNPPTVRITAPTNSSSLKDIVYINAAASDDKGITKVDFFVDGVLLQSISRAPFSVGWDTSVMSNANHVIRVRVTDNSGQTESSSISVRVNNTASTSTPPPPSPTPPTDDPPSVNITSPQPGSTVSGNVLISATATDDKGVVRVNFYINDNFLSSDSSRPFSLIDDSSFLANGTYTLRATAIDTIGQTRSHNISITVNNNNSPPPPDNPPTITINSPTTGATVMSSIAVFTTAADDNGVDRVEFYVDGAFFGSDTTAPYQKTLDSTTLTDGTHTVSTTIYDTIGQTTSDSITIDVDNAGGTYQFDTSVVLDNQGDLHLFYDDYDYLRNRGSAIYHEISYDNGQTWVKQNYEPINLLTDFWTARYDPKAIVLSNGNIVLTYAMADCRGNPGTKTISNVSTNNGLTWQGPYDITTGAGNGSCQNNVLEGVGDDQVLTQLNDGSLLEMSLFLQNDQYPNPGPFSNNGVFSARSIDNGRTWTDSVLYDELYFDIPNTHKNASVIGGFAYDPSTGKLYLSFAGYFDSASDSDPYSAKSSDNGLTWTFNTPSRIRPRDSRNEGGVLFTNGNSMYAVIEAGNTNTKKVDLILLRKWASSDSWTEVAVIVSAIPNCGSVDNPDYNGTEVCAGINPVPIVFSDGTANVFYQSYADIVNFRTYSVDITSYLGN